MAEKYWISGHKHTPDESLEILNEFLLSLKLAHKSRATITKYRYILETFLSECRTPIHSLTSDDVSQWLRQFSEGKKERTIDLYLSCLSKFFQFCFEEDLMTNVVTKKRWRPKIPDTLPQYLSEEELTRVKIAAETMPVRDRALILFLFSSGCRRGELINLVIGDIDLEQRSAQVLGKRDQIRTIHFSTECAIALKTYLNTRIDDPEAPLFMNRFGDRLERTGVSKIVNQIGEQAELDQTLHPHICRHTFATHMLARGADLGFIAEEMGHSDLNTTRVYARIPTEDMRIDYQNKME